MVRQGCQGRQGRHVPQAPLRRRPPLQSPSPAGLRRPSKTAKRESSPPLSLERLNQRTEHIEDPVCQALFGQTQQPVRRTLFVKHLQGCPFHDGHMLGIGRDHPTPPKFKSKSRLECNCAKIISGGYERERREQNKENIDKDSAKEKVTLGGRVCAILSWSSPTRGSSSGSHDEGMFEDAEEQTDEEDDDDDEEEDDDGGDEDDGDDQSAYLPLAEVAAPNLPKTPIRRVQNRSKVPHVPEADGYEGEDEDGSSCFSSDIEIEDPEEDEMTEQEEILMQSASSGRTTTLSGMTTEEEVEQESDIDTEIEDADPDETDEYELPAAPSSYNTHYSVGDAYDDDDDATEEDIHDDDDEFHQEKKSEKQRPHYQPRTPLNLTADEDHTRKSPRGKDKVLETLTGGPKKVLWFPVTQWEQQQGFSDLAGCPPPRRT